MLLRGKMTIYETIRNAVEKAILGAAIALPVLGGCYTPPISQPPVGVKKAENLDLESELKAISVKTGIPYEKVARLYLQYNIERFKDATNALENQLNEAEAHEKKALPVVEKCVENAHNAQKSTESLVKDMEELSKMLLEYR